MIVVKKIEEIEQDSILENSIVNGNCIDVLKKLRADSFDLILTDPPYNLALDKEVTEKSIKRWRSSTKNTFITADWDKYSKEEYLKFSRDWIAEAYRVLKPKRYMAIWNSFLNIPDIVKIAEGNGLKLVRLFVWAKTNAPISFPQDFVPSCEYCMLFYKKSDNKDYRKFFNGKYTPRDFVLMPITSDKERQESEYHPTAKPKDLMKIFIRKLSVKGELVLDCFGGSGVTAVACNDLERRYTIVELDNNYCSVIAKRINTTFNIRKVM